MADPLATLNVLHDEVRAARVEVQTANRRRTWLIVLATFGLVLVIALGVYAAAALNHLRGLEADAADQRRILLECTTPGPKQPTSTDPTTGHGCYDRGDRRLGYAIQAVVDSNGNGIVDTREILEAIGRSHP